MSRFMEHIIDFDESQLKIPRDNNINNNNQNNNQVNNTNLLDIIKNTLDNSINSLNIIQQENAKNNINNQQEQKLADDNASVISSTNSLAFVGNYKNIRLPYIIHTNDFENDNYIGLSKFFNNQPKDIIGNNLNEQEEEQEIIVGVIEGSTNLINKKQSPSNIPNQNSQNPEAPSSSVPQPPSIPPQSNIPVAPAIPNSNIPQAPPIPTGSNIPRPPPITNNIPKPPTIPNPPVLGNNGVGIPSVPVVAMAPVKGGPTIPQAPPIPPVVVNPVKPKVIAPSQPKPKPKPVEEDFGTMLRRQVLARGKKNENNANPTTENKEVNKEEEENLEDILKKKIAMNMTNNNNNNNNEGNNEKKIPVNVPLTKETIKINDFIGKYDFNDSEDDDVDPVFSLKQTTTFMQNQNKNFLNHTNTTKMLNTIAFPQDNKIKVNDEKSKQLERTKTRLMKVFGDDDDEDEKDISEQTKTLTEKVNAFTNNKPKEESKLNNNQKINNMFDNPPKKEEKKISMFDNPPKKEEKKISMFDNPPKKEENKISMFDNPPKKEENKISMFDNPPKKEENKISMFDNAPKKEENKISMFDNPPKKEENKISMFDNVPKKEEKKKEERESTKMNDFQKMLNLKMSMGGKNTISKINPENNNGIRESLKIEYNQNINKLDGETNYEAIMKKESKIIKKKKPLKKNFDDNQIAKSKTVQQNTNLNLNEEKKIEVPKKKENLFDKEDKKEISQISTNNNNNNFFKATIIPNSNKPNLFSGHTDNNNMANTVKKNTGNKRLAFLYDDEE